MSDIPPNYFRTHYAPLKGRDWIRHIPAEDRQALARLAFEKSNYGRAGGQARAIKATRDAKGRFVKESK